jgi:hypothetical protein
MPKFVYQHDPEERQIFQNGLGWIEIAVSKSNDFKRGENEPGEMQIDPYSGQAKDRKRASDCQRTL